MIIRTYFALIALLISFASHAEIRELSASELNEFELNCSKDISCSKAWKKLQANVAAHQSELEQLCQKDKDACIKKQQGSLNQLLIHQVNCTGDAALCEKELNLSAEKAEDTILKSNWCDSNQEVCDTLKENRAKRLDKKMTWCDVNRQHCLEIVSQKAEQEKKRNENIALAQKKLNKKYNESFLQREDKWFLTRAQCDGEPEACYEQINKRMSRLEKQREKRFCNKGNISICNAIKTQRLKREESKSTWCETNQDICERAKQQLIASKAQ